MKSYFENLMLVSFCCVFILIVFGLAVYAIATPLFVAALTGSAWWLFLWFFTVPTGIAAIITVMTFLDYPS